jgi:hypothetical protein
MKAHYERRFADIIRAADQSEVAYAPWPVESYASMLRADCPVVAVDNIDKYFCENDDFNGKDSIPFSQFPCISPPFEQFFVEARSAAPLFPASMWGAFVRNVSFDNIVFMKDGKKVTAIHDPNILFPGSEYPISEAEWVVQIMYCMRMKQHYHGQRGRNLLFLPNRHIVAIRKNGEFLFSYLGDYDYKLPGRSMVDPQEEREAVRWMAPILFMALSFMHCKNVKVHEERPPREAQEYRQKQKKPPFVKFRVLDVFPEMTTKATSGAETGIKKALHIVRGHYAKYTEEHPLFGRIVGTFWRPVHARGNGKQGIVLKDYHVHSPSE